MEYGVLCHIEPDPGPENALHNEWISQWESFEIALVTDFGIQLSPFVNYIFPLSTWFVFSIHTCLRFWQQATRKAEI